MVQLHQRNFIQTAAAFIDNNLKDTTNNDCLTLESFGAR